MYRQAMYIECTCERKPSSRAIAVHSLPSMLRREINTATMNNLRADMLKVHESDVKQLVTAQYKSSCQTQLVVWACHGPSKT